MAQRKKGNTSGEEISEGQIPRRKAITSLAEARDAGIVPGSPLGTVAEILSANRGATNELIFAEVAKRHGGKHGLDKADLVEARQKVGVVAGRGGFLYLAGADGKPDLSKRLTPDGQIMAPKAANPQVTVTGKRRGRPPGSRNATAAPKATKGETAVNNITEFIRRLLEIQASMPGLNMTEITIPRVGAPTIR